MLQDRESSPWPSTRALLLLKLWARLYPVSDRRHPILTPAAILVSAHLALCRLTDASDIPRGLTPPLCSSLTCDCTHVAKGSRTGQNRTAVIMPWCMLNTSGMQRRLYYCCATLRRWNMAQQACLETEPIHMISQAYT